MDAQAMIVGAGPAGLAVSACLSEYEISNMILEKEDCCGSLWKKRAYKRLKLHLPKHICKLPLMDFPSCEPMFVSKDGFIKYLDNYAEHFKVEFLYNRTVVDARFDESSKQWRIQAHNTFNGLAEEYLCQFLIVATGENSQGIIPDFKGLGDFTGITMHSSEFESGVSFTDKNVLVVGSGNSGMEIAFDLANWDARSSIVVRSSVHVVNKELVQFGMYLLKYFGVKMVDNIVVLLSKITYGNIESYGLHRPTEGPFYLKKTTGRSPVIDVGTMAKIRDGSIKVMPAVARINEDSVEFVNGEIKEFDAIVFATGYKSTVKNWIKDDENLFDENGMPKVEYPEKWKGKNGLYAAGFSSNGLFGISSDAKKIADDISMVLGGIRLSPMDISFFLNYYNRNAK